MRISLLTDLIAQKLVAFELRPCTSAACLEGRPPIMRTTDLLGHKLICHAGRRETWLVPEICAVDMLKNPSTPM